MPAIPDSTKTSLAQRLRQHAADHWPQLTGLHVRYHGQFAYVEGELADGDRLPLTRLRYGGSASTGRMRSGARPHAIRPRHDRSGTAARRSGI